ncbi:MAG: ATP synthase F1 subunit delta [Crocinitomicaceae bacterium]|nr:ATP synthase F1 subunit delta [Crocinitomicaceae bacterium]
MKNSKVATRYARALMDLAMEQKNIDSVLGDMNMLAATCTESHDLRLLLDSPIVKAEKKIAIFEQVFEQFEKLTMSFTALIIKNGRESDLPAIAEAFQSQVKEERGIVPITLTSATALDSATKDAIIKKVQAGVDGQLEVSEQIDESLIGGFMVQMGDMRVDASVSSQLNNLKQRLTR